MDRCRDRSPEQPGERLALFAGEVQERRAVIGPYLGVRFGGASRTDPEDDQMQYQPPDRPWNFDDSAIPQELGKIATVISRFQ